MLITLKNANENLNVVDFSDEYAVVEFSYENESELKRYDFIDDFILDIIELCLTDDFSLEVESSDKDLLEILSLGICDIFQEVTCLTRVELNVLNFIDEFISSSIDELSKNENLILRTNYAFKEW